jgi:hypothetical protein
VTGSGTDELDLARNDVALVVADGLAPLAS